MSVYVSAYVWEHSVHKGTELLLLLAISDIAHKNGVAFPSVATLARFIRMSERNTQRVLVKLESSGELKIKRNGGPNGCHLFQVVMNTTLPLFSEVKGGDKLSPDKLTGDTQAHKGVTKSTTGGDTAMSPEPTEQRLNRKEAAGRRSSLPDEFCISERVRKWAKEKGFEPLLDAHLEKFLSHVKAHGSRYVDWDEAFMNCVRDDWGDVRRKALAGGARGGSGGVAWWSSDDGIRAEAEAMGIKPRAGESWADLKARIFAAKEPGARRAA